MTQADVDKQVAEMVILIRDKYELDIDNKAIVLALVEAFQGGVEFGREIFKSVMEGLKSE